jgi:predicted dehydrogenase
MSATELRIAVVGAGGRSRAHCRALSAVEGATLGAVCDVVPERAASAAEEFGADATYTDHGELLAAEAERTDAVYVVTPPGRMDPVVSDCLQAGLHTFAEKPPGVTADQTARWADLAAERDLRTMAGFQRRFHPLVAAAREAVAEHSEVRHAVATFHKHQIGDVERNDGTYNALLHDAVHVVDLLVACGEVAAVHGFFGQLFEPPERFDPLYANVFAGVFEYDGGGLGLLNANRSAGGRALTAEFHGRAVSAYAELHGDPVLDELVIQRHGESYADAERLVTGDVLDGDPAGPAADGTLQITRGFLEAVRSGEPTRIPFAEAVRTMSAVEGVLDGQRFEPLLEASS